MKQQPNHIPVYSLQNFSNSNLQNQQFQVEVFDANRHFGVKYPHRHDFFEVLFLEKGSGFHIIDSNKYEIKPPSIFFMSPGQAHRFEFSNDIEGYIFIFTPDFYLINQTNPNRLIEFPFFFTIQQDNPPLLLEEKSNVDFLKSLFKKGIDLDFSKEKNIEVLRSLLDLILTSSSSLYEVEHQQKNRGKGHIIVKQFYQLIEEFHKDNLTVNQFAEKLALTPNHLTQTIKKLTGKTTNEIIKSKQILEIKRLLIHTNLGVSEIANQFNFADQSYFTRFFRKETGKTPLQYRNSH